MIKSSSSELQHTETNFGKPELTLEKYWGYPAFRPLQSDIVHSVLSGKDTLALLPTGGGKSICYQVPAMMMEGLCIVISPLISLMEDQVQALKKRKIKAMAIHSFMTPAAIDAALDTAAYGNLKLLYVSPERIQTELFIERFKKMKVSFVAVDESHCISQWGHEFRPAYLEIASLRDVKPDVPFLALTATATTKVVADILGFLKMKNEKVFRQSFQRENISFRVCKLENKPEKLFEIIRNNHGTGIVYVRSRRKCKEISDLLQSKGYKADFYHAGLGHEQRSQRQHWWTSTADAIMVATNAFGMGIDKADVRFVVHWDLPDSPEAFYQEAGRAGRDGLPSVSYILFDAADVKRTWQQFYSAYPSPDVIRNGYQHLCNFYQLARNSLPTAAFDFDLTLFCQKSKMSKSSAWNTFKVLEQEGWISMSEGLRQPPTIQVIASKNDLLNFESHEPRLSELIRYLLRAYSGILDQPVTVDLNEAVRKTGISGEKLRNQLTYLHKLQLIQYTPGSSAPRLSFSKPITEASKISLSKGYQERKDAHFHRIKTMMAYAESNDRCRNGIIMEYFDEKQTADCGNCDVCLSRNNKPSAFDAKRFSEELKAFLRKNGPTGEPEIAAHFSQYNRNEIHRICRELLDQEVLKLNRDLEFEF